MQLVFEGEKLSSVETLHSCRLINDNWSMFLAYSKFLVCMEILKSSAYNRAGMIGKIILMMSLIQRRKQYRLRLVHFLVGLHLCDKFDIKYCRLGLGYIYYERNWPQIVPGWLSTSAVISFRRILCLQAVS